MFILRNKRCLATFTAIMLAGGVVLSLLGYNSRKSASANKACRSEYAMTMNSLMHPVSSEGVFYMFSEGSGRLIISIAGKLVTDSGTYNIGRRLHYKITRSQRGSMKEIQSTFIRSDKYPADNAPDDQVDHRLFGTLQDDGSKYKIEKLNNNTLVIGTYFSPLYICQFET
jgi:hypothetical protein